MAQQRGRGRGVAAWAELAARIEAAEVDRAARGVGRGVVAGAGRGGGAVGPLAALGAVGHGRGGPVVAGAGRGGLGPVADGVAALGAVGPVVAAAAANRAGGGGGRGVAATVGNPLGRWLLGNTNRGANSQKLPSCYGIKIDPKELVIYSAEEYLTGDPVIDCLYVRLASLYNTHGDRRVIMCEKEANGKLSRTDELNYEKAKEHLMEQIGELQQALRNHNARAYPIPKIFSSDPHPSLH